MDKGTGTVRANRLLGATYSLVLESNLTIIPTITDLDPDIIDLDLIVISTNCLLGVSYLRQRTS